MCKGGSKGFDTFRSQQQGCMQYPTCEVKGMLFVGAPYEDGIAALEHSRERSVVPCQFYFDIRTNINSNVACSAWTLLCTKHTILVDVSTQSRGFECGQVPGKRS